VDLDLDAINRDHGGDLDIIGGLAADDANIHSLLVNQNIGNTTVLKLESMLGLDIVIHIANVGLDTLDNHVKIVLVGIQGPVRVAAGDHSHGIVHVDLKESRKEICAGQDHVVKHQVDFKIRVLDTWDGDKLEGLHQSWHDNIAEIIKEMRLKRQASVPERDQLKKDERVSKRRRSKINLPSFRVKNKKAHLTCRSKDEWQTSESSRRLL